jgi:uncharacterized protein
MSRQILFIQGGGSGAHEANETLVRSLRETLGAAHAVRFPRMPHEDEPDYQRWRPVLAKELSALRGDAILVGHSLGASFLLKYLTEEKIGTRVAGLFLIATPYWGGDGWRYAGFERVALRDNFVARLPPATPLFLYHGRDDEVVPFTHLGLYAKKIPRATVRALEGRGHQLNNDLSEVAADIKSISAASAAELRARRAV